MNAELTEQLRGAIVAAYPLLRRIRDDSGKVLYFEASAVMGMMDAALKAAKKARVAARVENKQPSVMRYHQPCAAHQGQAVTGTITTSGVAIPVCFVCHPQINAAPEEARQGCPPLCGCEEICQRVGGARPDVPPKETR